MPPALPSLPPLTLPTSREEIAAIQSRRKIVALEQAKRAPFYRGRLDHIDLSQLDDPREWRKIPILDKEALRSLSDAKFYERFCLPAPEGIAEYWRSGGATGKPLFYPRSFTDIEYGLVSFARTFACIGVGRGERAHNSFPLGIHPAGQIYARSATQAGIAMNWAGAGTTTPSQLQLELIARLKPSIWMGMSSYGLHLANLAEAQGIDLAAGSVKTLICSAEPLSEAKRAKLERAWGARVRDTFGMTEVGMMGAEDHDGPGQGFRVWTDMAYIEVVDPDTHEPVAEGEVGALVVTPLWSNNITPFLRWLSGDLVTLSQAREGTGPFAVFPLVRHAHRTSGFFKVRGINVGHTEFEDFMFATDSINDFKCELLGTGGLDTMRVSVELARHARGADVERVMQELARSIKHRFEVTAEIVLLDTGTLAREFESSVKAPRFIDKRS